MTTKRIMCEVVFVHGEEEAKVAEDKLRAAGFGFMVSDDPDDIDEGSYDTRFGMIWMDFDANVDAHWARKEFQRAVLRCGVCGGFDRFGFVQPGHEPTHFSDFGKRSAAIDELNNEARAWH